MNYMIGDADWWIDHNTVKPASTAGRAMGFVGAYKKIETIADPAVRQAKIEKLLGVMTGHGYAPAPGNEPRAEASDPVYIGIERAIKELSGNGTISAPTLAYISQLTGGRKRKGTAPTLEALA